VKESWETIKAFLSGWAGFVVGIGAVAILLYVLYLIIKAVLF
jgi:hypothetical protein